MNTTLASAAGRVSGPARAVVDGEARLITVAPDGSISAISPDPSPRGEGLRWVTGFTDLHVHGGGGFSFDDADPTGLTEALAVHHAHGVRRSLLSLVSAPIATLVERMGQLAPFVRTRPDVLGLHLEGPFIAPTRRGAHAATALTSPAAAAVEELIEASEGTLRLITIAPELPGALDAIDRFMAAGVTVAIGHTEADASTAAAAFDRGASVVTHALNAMPGLGHREPGPVGAALERDHVTVEVIADGIHVHPVVIRTLFAAAPGRIALVSDAMAATGCGDGHYHLGGLDVTVDAGRPVLTGTDTLAGSTLTLDRAVQVAVAAGVPIDDAVAAATSTPARTIGANPPSVGRGTQVESLIAIDVAGRRDLLDLTGR